MHSHTKNILIIGGTGCISTAVVRECLKHSFTVTMINRGHRMNLIPENVKLIRSDINDQATIRREIGSTKFDAVVDFLCYSKTDLEKSFLFYSLFTKQYFFISSCAVYDFRKTHIAHEDSPKVDARWDYSIEKWAAEERLRELAKNSTANYTIIRPSITYGDTRIPYGITPEYGKHGTIIQRTINNKPWIRWNLGENRCNMMHVEDFSRAIVKLIGNELAYNQEYNICSEESYTYNDVIMITAEILGRDPHIVDISAEEYGDYIPWRKGEILAGRGTDCVSCFDKFKNMFPDFKEQYTLKEGITKTINAYKNLNWIDGISYDFDGECDRIIHDCQKKSSNNIGFIDYLGEHKLSDFLTYYSSYRRGKTDVRILNVLLRLKALMKKKILRG